MAKKIVLKISCKQEQIRKRKSYTDFGKWITKFKRMKITNPQIAKIMIDLHSEIDNRKGFHYEHTSFFAKESIHLLLIDRGIVNNRGVVNV